MIKRRVDEIEVFLVHFFFGEPKAFAKALEMNNFTGSQELDDIVNVRIVRKTQDVVIGDASFLLCCQILSQVGDQISFDLHTGCAPRETGGSGGIDTRSVIHEVGIESSRLDVLF